MKKVSSIIFSIGFLWMPLLCILFFSSTSHAYADDEKTYYAKVQNTGVQLCSMPNDSSALFEIPYSYFVKVDYVVDDFYKVTYKDLDGYVRKDSVTLMDGEPITPFANATFEIYVDFPLCTNADKTSEILQLDESATITYYGTKTGEELQTGNNVWFFCSVQNDGVTEHGYVFSGVTNGLTTINVNNEIFETVTDDVFSNEAPTFTSLSTGTKIMLIVAISVPSVLILYFLIKPSKIMQITKTKKKIKQESKKVHHGDYFEFDESEL